MEIEFEDSRITIEISSEGKEISLCLHRGEDSCELLLVALWLEDPFNKPNTSYRKYHVGDYFQHTFISNPVRSGLGTIMHRFLIAYRSNLEVTINNIYSTKHSEDGYSITVDAQAFWENKVSNGQAIWDDQNNRFRILW